MIKSATGAVLGNLGAPVAKPGSTAVNLGSTVDLYYYAESDHVRSMRATLTDSGERWVIVTDTFGTVHAFPLTSIQRMILIDSE